MRWKENELVDYLNTKSGGEATIDDIFEYFCVDMTNRNLANFRSCLKYMPAIDIRYRRRASFVQTVCRAKPMIIE
jgi:hypothetical protein